MSESRTALIFNLIFANINFPRVRKRIRMEKSGHFPGMIRKILFLPLEDTFRAIAKLVVLK